MARLSLQTIVDRLGEMQPRELSVRRVQARLGDGELDEATLRPYVGTLPDRYARRLVHRATLFEVFVMTWAPGQFTPVHDHAGHLGWLRLVRGQLAEQAFHTPPGAPVPELEAVRAGGLGPIVLEPVASRVISAVGEVAATDPAAAMHRLGNLATTGGDVTVTVHVHSLPLDRCIWYEIQSQSCGVRELSFDPPIA